LTHSLPKRCQLTHPRITLRSRTRCKSISRGSPTSRRASLGKERASLRPRFSPHKKKSSSKGPHEDYGYTLSVFLVCCVVHFFFLVCCVCKRQTKKNPQNKTNPFIVVQPKSKIKTRTGEARSRWRSRKLTCDLAFPRRRQRVPDFACSFLGLGKRKKKRVSFGSGRDTGTCPHGISSSCC